MTRALAAAAALALSGCASWRGPSPGPTDDGIAVAVKSREPAAARREALESLLPLFVAPAARAARAQAVDAALAAPGLTGRTRLPKKGPGAVEVRVDAASAALRKSGAAVPPGYENGPETVLLAFGDRASAATPYEVLAADAFEVALFGRGLQAKDADDRLSPLKTPLKAKTEADAAAEAARMGWAWLAAGRAEASAEPEPTAGAWRAKARLTVSFYRLGVSTEPARLETAAQDVDVSSRAAVTHALELAAQDAAARAERRVVAARGGRATLAVLVAGRKDPAYLRRLVSDLRRVDGVAGAALVAWKSYDGMPLVHAYASGLRADELAARLLRLDPSVRVDAIETEDGRLTVEGPEVPENEDRGD